MEVLSAGPQRGHDLKLGGTLLQMVGVPLKMFGLYQSMAQQGDTEGGCVRSVFSSIETTDHSWEIAHSCSKALS
jgi:hypothetical protein